MTIERVRRSGGRTERNRVAVLGATREILYAEGLDNLAIREVARRAGVHETTIYRRWETKAALAVAAIADDIEASIVAPDSGDLRTDLEELLRSILAFVATPGGSALLHLAARQHQPGYEAVRAIVRAERFLAGVAVLERAARRGELRPGLDLRLLLESLIGPIHVRLLLTGGDLDEELVTATVDLFLQGVRKAAARDDEDDSAPELQSREEMAAKDGISARADTSLTE